MTRISTIAMALVIGLLAGSAANVRANSKDKKDHKDKGHKFIGLSPVDFPHKGHGDKDGKGHDHCGKDDCGKHDCGKDHCGNDSCHHGSKPTQVYPGGSKNGPPGTPENPFKPEPLAWRLLGKDGYKNILGKTAFSPPKTPIRSPLKGLHDPLRPSPTQGQIPTLGTGINGFASAIGKNVGSAVGMGVTEAIKGVGSVATAAGDVVQGVANGIGDVASGVGSALESLL